MRSRICSGAIAAFVLAAASALANPALPPKWAFGVLFGCYSDEAGVLDAMLQLRQDYCGDMIWVDSSWLHGEYDSGAEHYIDFQFDPKQFPEPDRMILALRASHFHFGVWEWPFIDKSNPLYAYGASRHLFIADAAGQVVNAGGWHGVTFTGQFDFTNPEAVFWWDRLHRPLAAMGVEFYKLDTGGGFKAPGVLADGNEDPKHLRQWYHRAAYDLSAYAAGPGRRGFILTHNPPADANDQTPGIWTGDTQASWAGLRNKDMGTAAKLNTPETAAYWGGDTGGYNLVKQADGSKADATDELYIRWLEYSAFTPIQEFFSSKPAKGRFPWKFGAEAQKIFRQYTELRYRLLPFRYSNAQQAYHETPVQYPVWFIGKNQIVVGNGTSELLVQPITSPGATSAQVALPAGSDWVDFWSDRVFPGGTTVTIEAPLDRVPIFVRAGAIIPMGPALHFVDEVRADPLTIAVYPAGKSRYSYYEDDGSTTDYRRGAFTTTGFASEAVSGGEQFTIEATKGAFNGRLISRTYLIEFHGQAAAPASVTQDGRPLPQVSSPGALKAAAQGWYSDDRSHTVSVKFPLSATQSTSLSL